MIDCHAGVLGWNPGGPKRFSHLNYFTVGSGNSVKSESASGSSRGLYILCCMSVGTVDAHGSQEIKGARV